MDPDKQLLVEIYMYSKYKGKIKGIKNALEAGASVNGLHEQPFRPLMVAASCSDEKVVKLLVESGADLEAATWRDMHYPDGKGMLKSGSRAVHCAVHCAKFDNLEVLFKAGANPNATDSVGCTPLMAVFRARELRPEEFALVVKELLKSGADPELAAHDGKVALHLAARIGATHEVLSMLTSPSTLNHSDNDGHTPLYYAAFEGHEGTVSWLLAAGARDKVDLLLKNFDEELSSLLTAVNRGHGRVVRTILDEGIQAVGEKGVIPVAIISAINGRQVRLLQMLLADEGGEEALRYTCKRNGTASNYIDMLLSHVGNTGLDKKGAAIRRILERAPACRARSWGWPTDPAGPGVSGAVERVKAPLGVPIVRRPKNETFFTVRLARYCEKK